MSLVWLLPCSLYMRWQSLQTYTEKPGHNFVLSADFDSVQVDDYDALYVPGGRAPEYLSLNNKVIDIVKKFDAAKKPIASICHGQLIRAAADILKVGRFELDLFPSNFTAC